MRQVQRRRLRRRQARRRRCPGEKALDMCEVAKQVFDHEDVVTVLVADLDLVEAAAAARYSAAVDEPPREEAGTPD